jgi:hypothetical protein
MSACWSGFIQLLLNYLCKVLSAALQLLFKAAQERLAIFAEQPLCTNLCRRVLKQPADCLVECSIAACFPIPICFAGTCCKLLVVLLLDALVCRAGKEKLYLPFAFLQLPLRAAGAVLVSPADCWVLHWVGAAEVCWQASAPCATAGPAAFLMKNASFLSLLLVRRG